MRTLVPFDARDPNSRLTPVLDADERRDFAAAMLRDVLDTVRDAGGDPHVLATTELRIAVDAPVVVDDRSLSQAVDANLEAPSAVVMSDLAIATPGALRRAFVTPEPHEVAAAPGFDGGTNVLVVRHDDFSTDYHGTSFTDHRTVADRIGAPFRVVDSFHLAVDVDAPSDLPEVVLHGRGRAADWLVDAGFEVVVEAGVASVVRER